VREGKEGPSFVASGGNGGRFVHHIGKKKHLRGTGRQWFSPKRKLSLPVSPRTTVALSYLRKRLHGIWGKNLEEGAGPKGKGHDTPCQKKMKGCHLGREFFRDGQPGNLKKKT